MSAGKLTIWARNNSTGTLDSYPITIDANSLPTLNRASPGIPVTATSGTVISGLTLSAATYPAVGSHGASASPARGNLVTGGRPRPWPAPLPPAVFRPVQASKALPKAPGRE